MIRSRVKIGQGEIEDFYKRWGFIYVKGDRRFAAPEKKRDSTSYAEEAGDHEDGRTVAASFDYKVQFLIETPNGDLTSANAKITAWNEAVRETVAAGSDVRRCRKVTFYDDYKRCKIVGKAEMIETADEKDYYRRQNGTVMDCVLVELTIHVDRPQECDFNLMSNA